MITHSHRVCYRYSYRDKSSLNDLRRKIIKSVPCVYIVLNYYPFKIFFLIFFKNISYSLRDASRKSTNIDNAKVQWSAFICSWFGTPRSDGAGNLTFMMLRYVDVIGTSVVCILMNKNKCNLDSLGNTYVSKNLK